MAGKILISTAYLPPAEYFSLISKVEEAFVEKEENYLKQTYRNRCYILSTQGAQLLSVPVYLGSIHKTPVKNIRIDYSKRWQQVHLRAIISAYNSSPYFKYYFESFESIISKNHEYLLDLNSELTDAILAILQIRIKISYTTDFLPVENAENDFRYKISPKGASDYTQKEYTQVFSSSSSFIKDLSILDLIFNMGPESMNYL
jgi:hypothetical protein